MQPYLGGFLVTDGHHNRVLWVSEHGSIHEVATFGNVVPTGLETIAGFVFVTQMGPIPHVPEDGKVLPWARDGAARGGQRGEHAHRCRARTTRQALRISQGQWDGVGEGSRAEPNTGGWSSWDVMAS